MRIFIALLMGSIFVVLGFCAKLGIWRRWQAWQTDDGVPFLLRNAWAAMIPGGMAFVAVGVAGSMLPLRRDSLVIPSLALLIAFAGLTIAVLMAYRPPRADNVAWALRCSLFSSQRAQELFQSLPGCTFRRFGQGAPSPPPCSRASFGSKANAL